MIVANSVWAQCTSRCNAIVRFVRVRVIGAAARAATAFVVQCTLVPIIAADPIVQRPIAGAGRRVALVTDVVRLSRIIAIASAGDEAVPTLKAAGADAA